MQISKRSSSSKVTGSGKCFNSTFLCRSLLILKTRAKWYQKRLRGTFWKLYWRKQIEQTQEARNNASEANYFYGNETEC